MIEYAIQLNLDVNNILIAYPNLIHSMELIILLLFSLIYLISSHQ
jgi:hypothetical protein